MGPDGDGRRRFFLGLLILATLLLGGLPTLRAAAQPAPQAVLLALTTSQTPQGDTRLLLRFAGAAPSYSILTNGSDRPAIALAQTTRGSTATYRPQSADALTTVDFDQRGSDLVVRFSPRTTSRIAVTSAGERAIAVTFAALPAAAELAPPGSRLPAEADRAQENDGFEIVFLKYADVSEVVGLLTEGLTVKSNDTFMPQEPAFGSAGMTGSGYASQPAPSPYVAADSLGQSVDDSIAIDRRLNAIILKGSPERIARLKAKIAQIDLPVESVLLETMFVELDQTGAKNVGLDFNNASNQLAVATFQTGGFIPFGQVAEHGLTSVALQAAIYAQVKSGHGKIVSKPSISAQSGGTAKIVTGDALPILTSIALSGVNAVSQQVQYVNVGVTLQIAPRVSGDGYVTSHIFTVVSSVTGTSQGYPTISQREAETSASVRDGDTFVIGGLTQESDIASDAAIPGLSKLPLLGGVFTYKSGTRAKTELYIVVTPRIIHSSEVSTLPSVIDIKAPPDTDPTPAPPAPTAPAEPALSPPHEVATTAEPPPQPAIAAVPLRPAFGALPTATGVESPTPEGARVVLQVGAFPSRRQAEESLSDVMALLTVAAGHRSSVEAVLKDGKPLYRAQIAGFASAAEAAALCETLKASNRVCLVKIGRARL